ncbi:MAG TPA: hypothetical protein EYM74_04310 [Candidatus Marinimicrobia bacterium]|jgi:hypothetical protein|nr:hypothetical protein [Candidatus Neomarinimicrobiota bacterium]HIN26517.1 hypothetical protein [Candidatus Neomarinimicrobiota bacterium]|tara:strand:- start:1792 stop:2295 length:504 start_codon:yes stop_codon:yes gene_type:complete
MLDPSKTLREQNDQVKLLIVAFTICLVVGVSIGLVYIYTTESTSAAGTIEHYRGSDVTGDFDIPDKYPKTFEGMLLTTHTHVIAFAIIFLILGLFWAMNSIVVGWWKLFFLVEPFVSVLITFLSLWGIRYVSDSFSYISMVFGILTYTSFYLMAWIILLDLLNRQKR